MTSKIVFYILSLINIMNVLIYWSIRPIWFFINAEINSNPIGAKLIFLIIVLLSGINLLLLKSKRIRGYHWIILIPTAAFVGLNIYLVKMLGSEQHIVIRNLMPLMPLIIIILLLILLVQKRYTLPTTAKGLISLIILTIVLFPMMNLKMIKITSGPNLQYVDDELAVLWTTNVNSIGFVEYGQPGDLKVAVNSENGIVDGNAKRFKVVLSDIEDGDIIRVGSTKIKGYYQNNIEYGETVYSDTQTYNDTRENEQISFIVLSDIHERHDIYEKYLNSDYDFAMFNGDIISSIDDEEIIVTNFLEPLSNTLTRPFYFTRGNHETRGKDARMLDDYLALKDNKYYCTFSYGNTFFIVLDSGEDKADNHIEYGGLANYKAYRDEETEWLNAVLESGEYEAYEHVIAFSHIPLVKDPAFPFKEEWMTILDEMSTDVVISGHTHYSELITTEIIPIVVGGGYVESDSGYVGLKVSVGENIKIDFQNEDGSIEEHYEFD